MTHWKQAYKSDHLACCDLDGKEVMLVIEKVVYEECTLSTGKQKCNVAYFTDKKYKGMILNVTNAKIVKKFANNSPDLDTWINIPVTIYINPNVRFGNEVVEGLRIRPIQPKIDKPILLKSSENYTKVVAALESGINIQKVIDKYNIEDTLFNELKTIVKK